MALKSSGKLTLGGAVATEAVAAELNKNPTALITLNDTDVRALAGIPSGRIRFPLDFYGKSSIPPDANIEFPARMISGYQDSYHDGNYAFQAFVVHPVNGEVYIFGAAGISEYNYGWNFHASNHFYVELDSAGNQIYNQYYLLSGFTYNYDIFSWSGYYGTGNTPLWGEANMVDGNDFVYFSGKNFLVKWNGITGAPVATFTLSVPNSPAFPSSFPYAAIANVVDRATNVIYTLIEDWNAVNFGFSDTGGIILTKMNAAGTLLWKYLYTWYGANRTDAVRLDSSGNIYLTLGGKPLRAGGNDIIRIEKLDSDGNWIRGRTFQFRQLGGTAAIWGGRITMSVDSNNNIYTFFHSTTANTNQAGHSFSIVKLNTDLTIQWQKKLTLITGRYIFDFSQLGTYSNPVEYNIMAVNDADGNLYLWASFLERQTTLSYSGTGQYLIKVDSNGNKLWEKRLDGQNVAGNFLGTGFAATKMWIQGTTLYLAGTLFNEFVYPNQTTKGYYLTSYMKLPISGAFNGPTTINTGVFDEIFTWATTNNFTFSDDSLTTAVSTAPTRTTATSVTASSAGITTTSGSAPVVGNIPSGTHVADFTAQTVVFGNAQSSKAFTFQDAHVSDLGIYTILSYYGPSVSMEGLGYDIGTASSSNVLQVLTYGYTGTLLASSSYGIPSFSSQYSFDVNGPGAQPKRKVDSLGNNYLRFCYSTTGNNIDVGIMKFSPTGTLLSTFAFRSPMSTSTGVFSNNCVDSTNDAIYLVGKAQKPADANYINIIKSNTSGTILWQKEYPTNGVYNLRISSAPDLVNGGVFVTSSQEGTTRIEKISASGTYVNGITAQFSTSFASIACDSDKSGNLYVTVMDTLAGIKFRVMKFNNSLVKQWERVINSTIGFPTGWRTVQVSVNDATGDVYFLAPSYFAQDFSPPDCHWPLFSNTTARVYYNGRENLLLHQAMVY